MTFEPYIPNILPKWQGYPYLYVTIRTKGCIAIHTIRELPGNGRLFPGTRVVLYYSTERKVIGIKPINDQSEYSPIKILGTSHFPLIYCKPFLDHYKIPYRYKPDLYDASWNHEAGTLMIKLK